MRGSEVLSTPRHDYYRCVEDHFEDFEQVYEKRFELTYGFCRPYLRSVIYRYLVLQAPGLMPFLPPKASGGVWRMGVRRGFEKSPRRHFVFGIPKILRRYFLYERPLLSELSRCVWESLKVFLKETVPQRGPVRGCEYLL